MSAHRIYCWVDQKAVVESYLRDLGVILTCDVPYIVRSADQIRGLDHITFIIADDHESPVPQSIWQMVIADGALVIHIDDQYVRNRRKRVRVRHYEPAPDKKQYGRDSVEQENKDYSPCGS